MLQAVMLLILYGTVIGSGGNVYVLNAKMNPVSFMPSNNLLSESLKIGGDVVGLSYSPNQRAYLILKFVRPNFGNIILTYVVKEAKNPVKLKIYLSRDGHNWRFVKYELATKGIHRVILQNINSKNFYIKILCYGALKGEHGASLIDAIYIVGKKIGLANKIDLNTMQVYLNGMWISLAVLIVEFLAIAIGVATFVEDKRIVLLSSFLCFMAIFVLSFVFNMNGIPLTYLFNSTATMVINTFIYGIVIGFALSKIFKK